MPAVLHFLVGLFIRFPVQKLSVCFPPHHRHSTKQHKARRISPAGFEICLVVQQV